MSTFERMLKSEGFVKAWVCIMAVWLLCVLAAIVVTGHFVWKHW